MDSMNFLWIRLFSLLHQYNESTDTIIRPVRRPAPQRSADDDDRKRQARDVLPKRVLNEDDDDDDDEEFIIATTPTKYQAMDPQPSRTPSSNSSNHFNHPHPDIPATSISKKFMDMATLLEQSPLRTVKKTHLMDIPPRIKQRINYANAWDNHGDTTSATSTKGKGRQNEGKGKQKQNSTPPPSAAVHDLPILGSTTKSPSSILIDHPQRNQHGELIFTISIFQAQTPSKKLQEFHLLGSQPLTALRDALYCRMDFAAHGDRIDQRPDGQVVNTFRQKLSPSFFYIDKTYYVDQRRQPNPEPDTIAMEDMVWRDLPCQLNTPYLFEHQQQCQHVVMIRDIRLLGSRDKLHTDPYPMVTYSWRYRRYKCNMCMIYPAVYITTNDYLSGFSPCFFCERCYEPFHFDKLGNPVTTFDVCAYHGT
ncbi:unnamed protein product [Absidia cylindrospora]